MTFPIIRPVRLQLSRKSGFRLVSPNALPIVKVDRTTRWGNPYRVGDLDPSGKPYTENDCIELFAEFGPIDTLWPEVAKKLQGKNLACWCSLCEKHSKGKPAGVDCSECAICHADVLLRVANAKEIAAGWK